MGERIDRKNDENLYQPKIHSDRIRDLYQIKEVTGIPMTVLVDMAILKLLDDYQPPQVGEAPQEYAEGTDTTI